MFTRYAHSMVVNKEATMPFVEDTLNAGRPAEVNAVSLPRREAYYPSPTDWRNEVLYFLLVDRFSDHNEHLRPLLNRDNLPAARPAPWRWDDWSRSGGERWQGGTLQGGAVDSHGDHRIAMAFAMAALRAAGTVGIRDCANVNTSFPGFVELASQAGLSVRQLEAE